MKPNRLLVWSYVAILCHIILSNNANSFWPRVAQLSSSLRLFPLEKFGTITFTPEEWAQHPVLWSTKEFREVGAIYLPVVPRLSVGSCIQKIFRPAFLMPHRQTYSCFQITAPVLKLFLNPQKTTSTV